MSSLRRTLVPLARDVVSHLCYRTGLTRAPRGRASGLAVVTFHRVLPDAALREYPLRQLAVSVDELTWFVELLRREYTCGTLVEAHRRWLEGERPERPLLAITFDDGQLDNYEHARPVLDRAGVKASFFVPVDAVAGGPALWHDRLAFALQALLGRDRRSGASLCRDLGAADAGDDRQQLLATLRRTKRLPPAERLAVVKRLEAEIGGPVRPLWDGAMTWAQLRALVRDGHEVGSHTVTHALLPPLDDAQLDHEVGASKARLDAELGVGCDSFCYPNGDCDERVVDAVRRAGYRRAVTTAWGLNHDLADPLRLTRFDLDGVHARDRAGRLSEARLAFRLSRFFPGPRA